MGRSWGMLLMLLCCSGASLAEPVPFADPYILAHGGAYYAYGTMAGSGIAVAVSEDLTHWRLGVGKAQEGLALHKSSSYGEKWFWAPEVVALNGRFYMLYTADERQCLAVSDSPLGPFLPHGPQPYLPFHHRSIDGTLFIEDDGSIHLFFVRCFGGNSIWSVELTPDLLSCRPETLRYCTEATQAWELKEGLVNEGPSVLKHDGKYYLLYSGNGYTSKEYGVGVAVADSLAGPWRKHPGNPFLQSVGGLVGVGHGAPFRDMAGRLRYVFHAHNSTQPHRVHPRLMFLTELDFDVRDGMPCVRFSPEFRRCELVK